jgi:predicted nucleic acid-binding protein
VILPDTNILIYATDSLSNHHEASKRVVDAVVEGHIQGAIVPQVLVEFLGATTGPAMANPLPVSDAIAQVARFRSQIRVLQPPLTALAELEEIAQQAGRAGRRVFDYFLAAQARALGVSVICTYNGEDFKGISGITVVTPEEVTIPPRQDEPPL